MGVTVARDLQHALDALAADPAAQLLAGGTDFMVEVNFGHRRPSAVVDLTRVPELAGWSRAGDDLVLGAGLTYRQMEESELRATLPALVDAARTIGSPQIRGAGTLGGNLGTGSPAGDTLPVLAALDATVMLASRAGTRALPLPEFLLGPKRTALAPGEIIVAVRVRAVRGPQAFLKVGTRNSMVIAVCNLALVVDLDGRTVRCALGSVGPVPLRATEAEAWIAEHIDHIDWDAARVADPSLYGTFADLVAAAARPIDDHRSTADYRRHAIGVLARRALMRVLSDASP